MFRSNFVFVRFPCGDITACYELGAVMTAMTEQFFNTYTAVEIVLISQENDTCCIFSDIGSV